MTETSTTRAETNREIIGQAFDAWRQGTGAITDVFAPGMVWRIEGHSAASKEYRSKQQFIDEVLAPFGARFTVSEPFRPVTIRAVYADDDTVIVIWDGRGIASDGQPYENSYAWIMKLADGKVIDGTAFYDSISFNDLWARVQPPVNRTSKCRCSIRSRSELAQRVGSQRDWYCARRVTAPRRVIAKTKIKIAMAGRPGDSS